MTNNGLKTVGLSPKTILAFLVPLVSAGIASVGSYLATSDWNPTETRTLLTGAGAAFVAGAAAFLGSPGNVVPDIRAPDTTYQRPPA